MEHIEHSAFIPGRLDEEPDRSPVITCNALPGDAAGRFLVQGRGDGSEADDVAGGHIALALVAAATFHFGMEFLKLPC